MTKIISDPPSLLTLESNPNDKRLPGFFSSPVALIRVSSILVVLETVGHLSGYPWTSCQVLQETQLVHSMKAADYVFFGEHSSYWSLYSGWGLFIFVLLFTLTIILWLLSNLARLAPRQIGIITGIISTGLLACAYLSFRFFYLPSSLLLSATFLILLPAAVRLLRHRPINTSKSMIRVSVLYPRKEGAFFDWTYYLTSHIPLVGRKLGAALKGVSIDQGLAGGTPGSPAEFVTMAHLSFDSVEAFQTAFEPHAAEILGDVSKYTSIEPFIQISEEKVPVT